MHQSLLFVLMFFAGMGIPVMAALNASAGQQLMNPVAAVVILCAVALTSSLVLLAIIPQSAEWKNVSLIPPFALIAGVFFVIYIGSITYSAPKIGLGNAVLMVLIGQLICAALIDHFGIFGVEQFSMTLRRLAGFGAVAVGFWLIVVK